MGGRVDAPRRGLESMCTGVDAPGRMGVSRLSAFGHFSAVLVKLLRASSVNAAGRLMPQVVPALRFWGSRAGRFLCLFSGCNMESRNIQHGIPIFVYLWRVSSLN